MEERARVAYGMTMTRILIVDDDPILQRVYHSKLTGEGFAVETVGDGPAALASIVANPPDAVVLDLMLPGLGGVEVLKAVRSRERGRRLPVLVLSNLYLEEESAAAKAAGADLVLAKAGTTPRKVVEALRGLLAAVPPEPRPLAAPPAAAASSAPPTVALPELPPIGPAIVRGAAALDIGPVNVHRDRPAADPPAATSMPQIAPLLATAGRCLAALAQDPGALSELGRTFGHLGNRAVAGERWDLAKLAAAGESLVHQIKTSPRYLTPSTVRTLTQVVERLPVLATARTASTDLSTVPTLVLDDEGVSRTTMTLALSKVGLQGAPMADPRQALAMMRTARIRLILSDVMMDGMSGFQFAAAVRALPGYARTPIIFVTALTDFESQFKASAHGADDLIAKPFLLMELGAKALLHVLTGDGGRDPWEGQS